MDANEDEDMEYDGLLEVELEDVLHDLYNDSRISPPMPEDLIKAESKQGDQFKQQLIAMKRKLGYQVPEEKASAQEIERLQKLNEWRAKRAEQQQKFYSETDQLQMLSYEALERDPFSPSFSADQVASSETLMTRQMNKSAKERTEQQQTARVHLLAAKRLLRARSGQLAAIQRSQEEAEEKKASERHETPEAAAAAEAAASESEKHRFSEIKALGNDIAGLKALIGNLQSMVSGVEGVDEDDVADGAKSDAESPAAKSADDEGVFQIPEHVLNQQMKEMPTGFQDPAPAEVPWMGTRPQAISVMDYDLSKYQKGKLSL
jgi:chemotaxis protein histidine kinase CheA